MNKLLIGGVALAALAAMPAFAVQQRPATQPMTRASVQTMVQAQFERADANRDGFVTKAEAETAVAATRGQRQAQRGAGRGEMFARLDANKDGSISRVEFDARPDRAQRGKRRADRMQRRGNRPQRGGMMGARAFDRADSDRDGRLSLAESTAARLARFDRADANRDGSVTREEQRAVRAVSPNG